MGLPFTLQQLRIIKAVASEKNFTKAAQILFISQIRQTNSSEIIIKQTTKGI